MTAAPDPLDVYRDAARAGGFLLTPYRLGLAIGKAHAFKPRDVPACPYSNPKTVRTFKSGVLVGIRWAREDAAKARMMRP